MSRADIAAGRAFVSLYVKQDAFTRGLQTARADLNKFGADMISVGAKVVAAATAMAAPVAFSVKTFADFDDAMRTVGAVSQATAADLQRMTDEAKRLGATTSFTAVQVAHLMAELGRAGFKPDQVNAMTGAVMDMARATGTDATLASGIMAASLRQFNLDATDAARVADVLTHAANATFNSVESLGEALKYAGPVAAELGLSLEDTVAILGTLGNVGIQGSEAGTALRRLGVISAATGEKLNGIFNINNVDAAGNLKPLVQIMGEIGQAVENLPVAEKVQKMNEAFGLLGITSASVLSRTAGDTAKLAEELKNADGVASKAAKSMDSGLGGAFRIIMSAAEGLQLAIGKALSGSIQRVTETITGLIGQTTEWVAQNEGLVVAITAATISVGAFGASLIAIGVASKVAAIGFGVLLSGVGMIKGIFGIAAGAIRMFRAAAVGLATLMQATFATSVVASTVAVSSLAAAETASIITLVPYTAATVTAAQATALLGITSGVTSTALIATTGAMIAATGGTTGLIASSVGAATGLITLSGSAAVASAGVASVSVSAGLMSTAFTAASAVIAAAWGIILGPLTPFLVAAGAVVTVIGAIAASAGLATVRAMDFSEAWTVAKDALSSIIEIAKRVGGVLMTALQQGDYDVAFKAAMAGIKLTLATSLDAMKNLWVMFWDGAWNAAKLFFENVAKKTIAIVSATAQIFSNPVAAGIKMSQVLTDIAKNTNLSFGIDTKAMADGAKAELDKLEKELAARQAQRDAKAKQDADAAAASNPEGGSSPPTTPPAGDGTASGDASAAGMDAEPDAVKMASAFERETEALEQQIIALRQGEEAAERFRLAKQGLTDEEINRVMAMKAETEALAKQQEAAKRLVDQIKDYGDVDLEKNKMTPAQVAAKEKAAIEKGRQAGLIDNKTAAEAIADADVRQAEREHQERLKKFRGDKDATIGTGKDASSVGLKMGGASAATFSAQSLLSMGNGAGQGPQMRAMLATKRAIEIQSQKAQEHADAVVAAIKQSKQKHT